jgi:ATP-dependent protease ClpP protease subunit
MHKLDKSIKINTTDPTLLHYLHLFDVDIKSNHIYLMGVDRGYDISGIAEPGVEHVMASRFIKNINLCMRVNPSMPILIHLKSCGGYWEEGMAIYDAIKSCPSKVIILNYTHARSMTSLIFQAADKRVMMPHSTFMFHEGSYAVEGTMKQAISAIEFDKLAMKEMLNIYAERMVEKGEWKDKSISKIKAWLKAEMNRREEVYLTAERTIELGLADEIFNYDWHRLMQ